MDDFRITKRPPRRSLRRPRRNTRGEGADRIRKVREYFVGVKHQRFYYEGFLGHGGQGMIFKIAFKDPDDRNSQPQMLMMKYANDAKRFESESEILQV